MTQYDQGSPLSLVQSAAIVSAAIRPTIGIARIGNSASGLFIGPEVDEPAPEALGLKPP